MSKMRMKKEDDGGEEELRDINKKKA